MFTLFLLIAIILLHRVLIYLNKLYEVQVSTEELIQCRVRLMSQNIILIQEVFNYKTKINVLQAQVDAQALINQIRPTILECRAGILYNNSICEAYMNKISTRYSRLNI